MNKRERTKIYETLKEWLVKKYNLQDREIIRISNLSGDYENHYYPDNCIVIDNPPFGIFGKMADFLCKKNITFILFLPHLMKFISQQKCNYTIIDDELTFENYATISIGFIFYNFDEYYIKTSNN